MIKVTIETVNNKLVTIVRKRLESKLKATENGCLEFQGYSGDKGYGRISINNKLMSTHRLAYSLAYGEIPEGMFVLHKCDNPPCCNPDHLFLGTNRDNLDDMLAKGRTQKGEDKPFSKLKESEVLEIVSKNKQGQSQRSLAKEYGVVCSTIHDIMNGICWKYLTGIEGKNHG